jgi:hypothetical protein
MMQTNQPEAFCSLQMADPVGHAFGADVAPAANVAPVAVAVNSAHNGLALCGVTSIAARQTFIAVERAWTPLMLLQR